MPTWTRHLPEGSNRLTAIGGTIDSLPGEHHRLRVWVEFRADRLHGLQNLEFTDPLSATTEEQLAALLAYLGWDLGPVRGPQGPLALKFHNPGPHRVLVPSGEAWVHTSYLLVDPTVGVVPNGFRETRHRLRMLRDGWSSGGV